jgi:hypothetical protein
MCHSGLLPTNVFTLSPNLKIGSISYQIDYWGVTTSLAVVSLMQFCPGVVRFILVFARDRWFICLLGATLIIFITIETRVRAVTSFSLFKNRTVAISLVITIYCRGWNVRQVTYVPLFFQEYWGIGLPAAFIPPYDAGDGVRCLDFRTTSFPYRGQM